VQLAEQDIKEKYPWNYDELCKRMGAGYSDFKMNKPFHAVRKPLLDDEKPYFNANILQVFDQHYTRKVG
jgi:hypothetical protein